MEDGLERWLRVQNDEAVERFNLSQGSTRMTITLSLGSTIDLALLSERLLLSKTKLASQLLRLAIAKAVEDLHIERPGGGRPPEGWTAEDEAEVKELAREQFRRLAEQVVAGEEAEEIAAGGDH